MLLEFWDGCDRHYKELETDEIEIDNKTIKQIRVEERAKVIEEYRKEMQEMIEGDDEFTDWQKREILELNEIVAEELKE